MKVGDIVQFKAFKKGLSGIIVEIGVYTGNKYVRVMWQDGEIFTEKSKFIQVVNESR